MDIADKISAIARRGHAQLDHIVNEQATKTALVLPLLQALGYDPFDPSEVVPEYTADVGTKKGEKVDYAIRKDGVLSILIECKPNGTDLSSAQYTQLFRYFSCTEAKFAILTNGFEYRFYSDLDAENKLDTRPFFVFNMDDFSDSDLEQLKKFAKPNFDVDAILSTANRLKYTSLAKREIDRVLREAPDDFVKYIVGLIYEGRHTKQVLEEFTPIVKDAGSLYIKEQVGQRLKGALARNYVDDTALQPDPVESEIDAPDGEIVTTQEEIDGYNIVRSILSEHVDIDRIALRDAKSYCSVLLDDNNRKPLIRMHFNTRSVKRIGLFTEKKEERIEIESVSDIFKYRDRIVATALSYDS